MTIYKLWKLIIFLNFKTSLVITPPAPPTSFSRIAYKNRYVTHLLPIFNYYLFNRIKIVPIYAHESIDYLTIALLDQFSKIIMFFKFLLENISQQFENDYIHEIEQSLSVNFHKTAPILVVYCV